MGSVWHSRTGSSPSMAVRSPRRTTPRAVQYSRSIFQLETARKIITPTPIDEIPNIITHDEFIRKSRLGPSVDNDRRLVNQVMPVNAALRAVNVRGRFEPRPGGPQKVRGRSCHTRVVVQH